MSQQVQTGIQVILDPLTWQWLQLSIWVAVGLTIALIASIVYHLIGEHRTPFESKGIREASHKGVAGLLLASDSGVADFKSAFRTGSEGYNVTKREGKFKFHHTSLLPRPGQPPNSIDVAEGKDLDKTRATAGYINRLNTTKIFLRGAKIPLWIGVPSKGIVASILAIAGVQLTEEIQKKWADLMNTTFPIDVPALKQMVVSSSYNESQINAIEADSERIGEERAKKGDPINKLVIIVGLAMMGIGAAMLAIAAFV